MVVKFTCNAYTFGASKGHKVHAKVTLAATYACSLKKGADKREHSTAIFSICIHFSPTHALLFTVMCICCLLTSTFNRKTDYENGNEKLLLSFRKLNLCLLVVVVVPLRWRAELLKWECCFRSFMWKHNIIERSVLQDVCNSERNTWGHRCYWTGIKNFINNFCQSRCDGLLAGCYHVSLGDPLRTTLNQALNVILYFLPQICSVHMPAKSAIRLRESTL